MNVVVTQTLSFFHHLLFFLFQFFWFCCYWMCQLLLTIQVRTVYIRLLQILMQKAKFFSLFLGIICCSFAPSKWICFRYLFGFLSGKKIVMFLKHLNECHHFEREERVRERNRQTEIWTNTALSTPWIKEVIKMNIISIKVPLARESERARNRQREWRR